MVSFLVLHRLSIVLVAATTFFSGFGPNLLANHQAKTAQTHTPAAGRLVAAAAKLALAASYRLLLPAIITSPADYTPPAGSTSGLLPQGPGGDWRLIFQDEFDGPVDASRWVTCYHWAINGGCGNDPELQWYTPANVSTSHGSLQLTARREPVSASNGKNYQYTSGIVTTDRLTDNLAVQPKFSFKYGYVEMRAKLPAGQGFWSSFWLMPADHSATYEIDVMEVLGNDPSRVYMFYHHRDAAGADIEDRVHWAGPNFSQDWHTFGVEWRPDAIIWYVDGVERRRYTDASHISNMPMHILANLAVGGTWPGAPDAGTPFPSSFAIDYIRVWSRPGDNQAAPPPANLVLNAGFERPQFPWQYPWWVDVKPGSAAQLQSDGGAAQTGRSVRVNVSQASGTAWHVQLVQPYLAINAGQTYRISFWAKASTARTIDVVVQKYTGPYTEYTRQPVALTTNWQSYTLSFTAPTGADNVKLAFLLGGAAGQVWVDETYLGP